MTYWIKCGICGQVYDGGKVTVTARYADCSVWTSPCCGQQVDDRQKGWVSRPTAIPISEAEANEIRFPERYHRMGGVPEEYLYRPMPGESHEEFDERMRYDRRKRR